MPQQTVVGRAVTPFATGRENPLQTLVWPALLLFFSLLAAVTVFHFRPLGVEATEYGFPAMEFARTQHISSDFLSISYAAIVGTGLILFGNPTGAVVANVAIYLAYVAVCWIILRQLGATVRSAFALGVCFALYPDLLLSLNRLYHAIFSPLLMLVYIAAAIYLFRSRTEYRADVLMAVVLGIDIASRSNMILLFPVTYFLFWKYKLPHAVARCAAQTAVAVALFAAICIAVHGRVFWPRVGAYVLFSGANEYTGQRLLDYCDETAEGSLIPALRLRGIEATLNWEKPDNIPGDNDIRNPRFTKLYNHEALKFMRTHPWTMVELTGIKLFTLLRPDLAVHRAMSPDGLMKILIAFALPVWIVLCFVFPHPASDPERWIIVLTILAYIVPLLLSVTAPRNRVPVDVICLLDSAGILLAWWRCRHPKDMPAGVVVT